MTIEVTDSNFQDVVINSPKPVLVDFWAEWCGPCRMVAPVVKELSEDYKDQIVVAKMDGDSNKEVPAQFGIRNIPTILFFKGGEVVDKQIGAVPKGNLENKLKPLL